jgi:glycosyltransferase involved in cell wall biosynthesis
MKIVFDARMYGLEHAGIGRYILNLIHQIKNEKLKMKNLEITLLIRKKNLKEISQKFGGVFKILVCDVSHYSLKEQFAILLQLIKLKPDLVHFPHFNIPIFYPGRFVVTIHDLIKHTSKGRETTTRTPLAYWFKYLGYRGVFSQAVKRAVKIIVPSMAVKDELRKTYHLPEEKIEVIYEGVGDEFKIKDKKNFLVKEKVLGKYKLEKPFVIYTGSLYPHKNVERLLRAIICLNDSNHFNKIIRLVVVCARNVFYERFKNKVKEMKVERLVKFLGFVPDEDLAILYKQAEAFIFPSLSEGFGLPGLEAMACGLPVVCSDIAVFREIYGEAACYFDALDFRDMAQKIEMVIKNSKIREGLIKNGFERIKKYSWEKMAKKTLEVYESSFCI